MFLQPNSSKFKKTKKGNLSKFEFKSNKLKQGTIGLKALESGIITARQIESARQAIMRKMSRKGKLWIRVYPYLSISAKPSEVRMGKGKGAVSHWAARISAGQIIFEVCGVDMNIVKSAFKTGGAKLPVKVAIFY